MFVSGFEWDESNTGHILRHTVEPSEAEEAIRSGVFKRTRQGRYVVYGKTENGRYLLVVLARKKENIARVITAHDMTGPERKYFRKKRR